MFRKFGVQKTPELLEIHCLLCAFQSHFIQLGRGCACVEFCSNTIGCFVLFFDRVSCVRLRGDMLLMVNVVDGGCLFCDRQFVFPPRTASDDK